ncbi:hypothetical protein [Leifsonia xyli]
MTAASAETAEREALSAFTDEDVARLRRMLFAIIGETVDRGSCL